MNKLSITDREATVIALALGGMVHLIRTGQLGAGGSVPLPTSDEIIAIREKITPYIPELQSLRAVHGD